MNDSYENQNLSNLENRLRDAEGTPKQDFRSLRNRVMSEAIIKTDAKKSRWKQTLGLAAAVLLAFGLGRFTSPQATVEIPIIVKDKSQIKAPLESVQESAQKTVVKIDDVSGESSLEDFVRATDNFSTDDFTEEIRKLQSHRKKILFGIQGRL